MLDFWKKKQVLVTGAGGFLGSHLVEALLRQLGSEDFAKVVQWNGNNRISGYIEKPMYDYTVSMGVCL